MSEPMTFDSFLPIMPELFMACAAMVLLIFGALRGNKDSHGIICASIATVIVTGLILCAVDGPPVSIMNDMFVLDGFAVFMKALVLIGLAASLALSLRQAAHEGIFIAEFPVLILLSGLGMMLMISANNLLAAYVGFELQSLSLYVLAAIRRDNGRSSEAGLKYFVLGALASGMLLFGISIMYGFTGSLSYAGIAMALEAGPVGMPVLFGIVFLMAGIAFKISAVPFHMWTPDVYEGAPLPVTALFAMVPKIAAIALLIRLLFVAFEPVISEWQQIVWFLAFASMIWSAFAALAQTNIKRLMAYSSIGNMGYALLGVVAGNQLGISAAGIYMAIYLAMTAGTFAIIMCMRRDGKEVEAIADLSGLSRTRPVLAYSLAIMMFSMSGIPPLAGFFGKLVVFQAAVASGYFGLAVVGVLSSVVAAYYYLRVIKVMFFDEPAPAFDAGMPFARKAVLGLSIAFVLFYIVMPDSLMAAGRDASWALFPVTDVVAEDGTAP